MPFTENVLTITQTAKFAKAKQALLPNRKKTQLTGIEPISEVENKGAQKRSEQGIKMKKSVDNESEPDYKTEEPNYKLALRSKVSQEQRGILFKRFKERVAEMQNEKSLQEEIRDIQENAKYLPGFTCKLTSFNRKFEEILIVIGRLSAAKMKSSGSRPTSLMRSRGFQRHRSHTSKY
ncbi:413_t:CDS:2 [Ambispora leptoticha]|uniref:413_t:CDS:1 n=1 Tax=Ambispora leptoticha TaxID=144679 RepID=A0A9N8YUN0_9GLOM|nr:413_t:CDS:2 [Ambispora leptoticha]